MRKLVILIAAVVGLNASAAAQGLAPNTVWKNGRGSELTITTIETDGTLRGTFVNKAPGFQCENTPYTALGWVDGDKVSFSVRWQNASEDCHSITSWIGYLSKDRLITDWDLVYVDAAEQRPLIYRGTDFFTIKP